MEQGEGSGLEKAIEKLYEPRPLTVQEAVKFLIEELKNDDAYYISWQANIAMAFQDEYNKNPRGNIHEIANNAAKRFLESLTRENGS